MKYNFKQVFPIKVGAEVVRLICHVRLLIFSSITS